MQISLSYELQIKVALFVARVCQRQLSFVVVAGDAVQAILGRGIDNHLLGLRQIAHQSVEPCAMKTPDLFLDESYQTSNHFTLSTSQVTTYALLESFSSKLSNSRVNGPTLACTKSSSWCHVY